MRLPTELEDSDISKNATTRELSKIMAEPPSGKDGKLIFDSVDKIHQIIHNSASGNISRAKAKQSFYFEQRHRGVPLQIGDKVLHYNKRAGQRMGDKMAGSIHYSWNEWETEIPSERHERICVENIFEWFKSQTLLNQR